MKILVVDGQGGRIGLSLVEELINRNVNEEIVVVGTNSTATSEMLISKNIKGASGENPILVNSLDADIIIGPIGIIIGNSMLGEITPKMASAISCSPALKVLIPMNRCNVIVAGNQDLTTKEYIQEVINQVVEYIKQRTETRHL